MGIENLKKNPIRTKTDTGYYTLAARFDLKDPRDKEIIENFQQICTETNSIVSVVLRELLDEGIKAFMRANEKLNEEN